MIYITGDCHGNFRRFTRKQRMKLPFKLTEKDYVIVCGDFGLLWNKKDEEFQYNINWLSNLPFTILWVDGNHEGFSLLNTYPVDFWNGGKVHHIVENKIIHLMRGQVFTIEGKTFFTFGGASSHDIMGGILDKEDPEYHKLRRKARERSLPYRVLGESWWKQELPTEEELQEGRNNLEKAGWKVDYVITHCLSNRIQDKLCMAYKRDILTDYLDEIEDKLQYIQWFAGHYHINTNINGKHTILYEEIVPVDYITRSLMEE